MHATAREREAEKLGLDSILPLFLGIITHAILKRRQERRHEASLLSTVRSCRGPADARLRRSGQAQVDDSKDFSGFLRIPKDS